MIDAFDRAIGLIHATRAFCIPLDGYELLFGRDLLPELQERARMALAGGGVNASRGMFMGVPFRVSDDIHPLMVGMVKRA